jgi:amidohydrolase
MEVLNNNDLKKLLTLRKWLHKNPELSGREIQTSKKLEDFIQQTQPNKLISGIGGFGLAAIYHFDDAGPTVLVRADMDALPIQEVNTFTHKSTVDGVSHKCGHDGHSTILMGLATALSNKPLSKGRVVLLFQPEEETGKGAAKVISDEAFKIIKPDFVIALHNLPGFSKGSLVIKEGPFAAASKGMIMKIKGASSHAAHPEQGNSPANMLAKAILQLQELPQKNKNIFTDFTLLTIIHAKLGDVAFGTNPGEALLMATLRTFNNDDMKQLKRLSEIVIKTLAEDHKLIVDISYTEEFPATVNNHQVVEIINSAAKLKDIPIIHIEKPFRWSEDFGHFTSKFRGALFGIGSGEKSPGLHNNDYDFPDEILSPAVQIFYESVKILLSK